MCVIYEPGQQPARRRRPPPVIIVPYLGSQFSSFPSKVAVHRAGYLLVRWNVALMRRGQTCVADCTHFHLISF